MRRPVAYRLRFGPCNRSIDARRRPDQRFLCMPCMT